MNKSWDSGGDGYQATNDLRLSDYEFTPNNPYLSMPLNALSQPISTRNLTESLLQLEASVQQDSRNLESWLSLGKLQQENENDAAAIAALRKALEIDASNLDALLHLAVSYTNENYSSEAYDSLQSWIEMHPKYHEFAPKTGLMAVSQRHQVITQAFMRAAMSRPGEDLDDQVQSCLGVLFNISTEYSKAVDCFESAIARRPDDYQLWNKLG